MTDDEIRAILHEFAETPAGTPEGFARIPVPVIAQRADVKDVAVWVANHGGLVDGAGPYEDKALGRGRWERSGHAPEEAFLVPLRVLDAG